MKNCRFVFWSAFIFALLGVGLCNLLICVDTVKASNTSVEAAYRLFENETIRFCDPVFEEVVRGLIDKPSGEIMTEDVETIKELHVDGRGIVDLTGIEYFTALEVLNCRDNLLTELDVSQNLKLKRLACDMNFLADLDVSHNYELAELVCWENKLTTLDVSRNLELVLLSCDDNLLTALDVSRNPILESLSCGMNQLTVLDVNCNPALKGLYCYYNKLLMLNVKKNPKLENLNCSNNQLVMLEVTKNPMLVFLDCTGNELKSLDVGCNLALERLSCSRNFFANPGTITGLDESKLEKFAFDPQRSSEDVMEDSESVY